MHVEQELLEHIHAMRVAATAIPVQPAEHPLAGEFPNIGAGEGTDVRIGEVGKGEHRRRFSGDGQPLLGSPATPFYLLLPKMRQRGSGSPTVNVIKAMATRPSRGVWCGPQVWASILKKANMIQDRG